MYSDNKMVLQLLSLLKQFGIRRIVVSPGSRHFALVHSLEADPFFRLYSVVDERSAAFFALGLIQQTGEVVAITCSSGTACMNYGSAIVEAFYQRLPLLVLSSDRVPAFLNQLEDQMYDQLNTYTKCTKYQGQLPVIKDDIDLRLCNRILNEAFLELNHHGRGPVHINIPFVSHSNDTFSTALLPKVRKISLNDAETTEDNWRRFAGGLRGKKVMIIWGQSVNLNPPLMRLLNEFCEKTGAIILTDKISNLHSDYAIDNVSVTFSIMTQQERHKLLPDIVLSIGGNYIFNGDIKCYLRDGEAENWQIGKEDKVVDPFHSLTQIFEMTESFFFESINKHIELNNVASYCEQWLSISRRATIPAPDFNELYAIGALLTKLPPEADLQLANSLTIRMAHLFSINPQIRVNCNRGVNGIDGSMSTAVGFGADNNRLTFYITGDLSFFYDMNSLSIRHVSKRMRILLINNHGGGVMYLPLEDKKRETLADHIAARHSISAKGWVESLGFKYFSARSKEEVDAGVLEMLKTELNTPILLEVFTNINPDDVNAIRMYIQEQEKQDEHGSIRSIIMGPIKNLLGV